MPRRVLVADDEELERRALRLILGAEGMPELEMLEASNGLEALAAAGSGPLDAAFLDIRMPGMDGIETARELRRSRPGLPIVFLTAYDSFEYARSALRLRVEDFLLKPASAEEVAAALERALSSREPIGEAGIEEAASILEGELRSELGRGLVPEDLIARCLKLAGKGERVGAVVAMRIEGEASRRAGASRSAAALAERALSPDRGLAIAGSGDGFVLCLVACGEGVACGDKLAPRLEELVARARDELGLSVLVGAAASPRPAPGATAELARAARRAAALAGPSRPVLVLALSALPGAPGAGASAGGGKPRPAAGRKTALRALELLEERHAEELSLESVALALGVSPSHLSRLLCRHAGSGFADCLARLRVERAKAYLSSPGLSVKEASAMVGYRDPAYFARVFRRFAGESPAEFRSRAFGPEGGEI